MEISKYMKRATGVTTRIIDSMIQKFFDKGYVEMIPLENHYIDMARSKDSETLFNDGHTYKENRVTFYKFLNRLEIEHRISIRNGNLKVKELRATLINKNN